MDLSTAEIFIGLATITVMVCLAAAVYVPFRGNGATGQRRLTRSAEATTPTRQDTSRTRPGPVVRPAENLGPAGRFRYAEHPAPTVPAASYDPVPDPLEDTGRHHVPPGLLDAPTTRINPDVLARVTAHRTRR